MDRSNGSFIYKWESIRNTYPAVWWLAENLEICGSALVHNSIKINFWKVNICICIFSPSSYQSNYLFGSRKPNYIIVFIIIIFHTTKIIASLNHVFKVHMMSITGCLCFILGFFCSRSITIFDVIVAYMLE